MNLLGLSGSGGGALELDPVLFLFPRTAFLGAIENEEGGEGGGGGGLEIPGFWKEEREFRWCEN